ncbi:MAG TPA: hypothetical protein VJ506_05815, partial [Candidatus Limnocylindrales bacterium]|nr:hypothetical protein [Candidatus Limnocylindrales bacterium]
IRAAERLPGPRLLTFAVATVAITIPMHAAEWIDRPERVGQIRLDLVTGAAAPLLFIWAAIALNNVALRSLRRLEPALDPAVATPEAIAPDLLRTPRAYALIALVVGVVAGVTSVLESPENWGVDAAHPYGYGAAIAVSVVTDVILLSLLAHVIHQLRVVSRVHRDAVRIDVFQLEPLYAFSSLTAWTGLVILALLFGLIGALSLTIGRFLLQSSTDIAMTAVLFAVAIACFVVPLLGLHGRIVDEKRERQATANAVLAGVVAEAAERSRAGDFDGLARLKDAALTAESAVSSIQRIPTWPWRRETLRGFSSAVILPIVLWLLFQGLTRVLPS